MVCQPYEISTAISKLRRNKAAGSDTLCAENLIFCSQSLHILLSMLFTSIFFHGNLPESLVHTLLIPLLKNKAGDLSDRNNYRPIALANIISKVFEIILLNRCEQHLSTTDFQFGFKQKHSVDMCIYVLKEIVDYYRSNGSPVYICSLDASKAFDKVNHSILFSKLVDRNVPMYIVRVLSVWYSTQQLNVQWGRCHSETFGVSNGVRQGGILSPKLFNIYIDTLSSELSQKQIGCCLGNMMFNHLIYADDMLLLCPSAKGLQTLIDICIKYANGHDIIFNSSKTCCMLFQSSKNKIKSPSSVYLDGDIISFVNSHKYLGVKLSESSKDNEDVLRQTRSFYIRANMLIRKFAKCSYDVKIKLFNSYCSAMYCSHLWSNVNNQVLKKVRVSYNNAFRKFLGYPRDCSASGMFVSNRLNTFDSLWRQQIYNFCTRIEKSNNSLVKTILSTDLYMSSSLRTHWRKILYI